MTIYHILIVWLLIAVLSFAPLVLAAVQARRYWSVIEMRLLMAALFGQALFQSNAAWQAFTILPATTLDRAAPSWLILFTAGDVAMAAPLVALAIRMLLRPPQPAEPKEES